MSSEPIPEPPNVEAGDTQGQIERLSQAFEDIKKSLGQFKRIAQPRYT